MRLHPSLLVAVPVVGFLSGGWISGHAPALVAGLPFLMVWNSGCILATSIAMPLIYRSDPANGAAEAAESAGASGGSSNSGAEGGQRGASVPVAGIGRASAGGGAPESTEGRSAGGRSAGSAGSSFSSTPLG